MRRKANTDRRITWRALGLGLFVCFAVASHGSGRAADTGARGYRNPILAGDYSDPDVIAVGEDFYLVSSSFNAVPGLPILHSRDLVNWTIIGHALPMLTPVDHYRTPRRGGGAWAPTLRWRDGKFLLYYSDPDYGIFLITASDPKGPWSDPLMLDGTPGAIDPAPFWDDDGQAWLVNAWAKSRAGRSNLLTLRKLGSDGRRIVGPAETIVDGDAAPPVRTSIGLRPWQTTEGPKLYKRNGWYYVFAPSGSVKGGWQGVFRSRSIHGPYEGRDVLDQGPTAINGPHQGAWISTARGEDWFVHFHDHDSWGRRVFLEPMRWHDDWPVIGVDPDGDGIGQPVDAHAKPRGVAGGPVATPVSSDRFDGRLNAGWQWQANPGEDWATFQPNGGVRLVAAPSSANLWEAGNLLSQKLPAERFTATVEMRFRPFRVGERAGLAMFGSDYGWIGAERRETETRIVMVERHGADRNQGETVHDGPTPDPASIWVRLTAVPIVVANPPPDFSPWWPSMLRSSHAQVRFSYSVDGKRFTDLGPAFVSRPGRWTGAQIALFAQAASGTSAFAATTNGHADFARFEVVDTTAPALAARTGR